jgi:CheY-like chemotaxis protein
VARSGRGADRAGAVEPPSNAARYTEPGGRIALRGRVEAGQVLLAVEDSGMGFDPGHGPRLFEMFTRGERSQGLGIGLALSRRLVEMHGGTLTGESAGRGRGATFTVSLPLGAPLAAGPAPSQPADALPPIRVLVVDDNRDAAETLQMLLDLLGAQTRIAHAGEAALALFEAEPPDAVLLDIGMPGMDGYQVARAIRARGAGTRPTLVALTGWGQQEDRLRAQDAGFDHHLVKPAELDKLETLFASLAVH